MMIVAVASLSGTNPPFFFFCSLDTFHTFNQIFLFSKLSMCGNRDYTVYPSFTIKMKR